MPVDASRDVGASQLQPESSPLPEETSSAAVDVHLPTAGTPGREPGREIRAPAASALPGALALARALRPLMRRVKSRTRVVFDEAATVDRIAQSDGAEWLPVLLPASERRFTVSLVVDSSLSMSIWRRTAQKWLQTLEWTGAFRRVVAASLDTDEAQPKPRRNQLRSSRKAAEAKLAMPPDELHLVLVLSDCVSRAWWNGAAFKQIESWSGAAIVTLLQVLPETMWPRTAMSRTEPVRLKRCSANPSNRTLDAACHDAWLEVEAPVPKGLRVPIVTLDPEVLGNWSKSLAGAGGEWLPGVIVTDNFAAAPAIAPADIFGTERVRRFRESASRTAMQLAGLLAVAPVVTLQAVRWIRSAMLPAARQVHEAEVLLGGLLRRPKEGQPAGWPQGDFEQANDVYFEFYPGVAEELQQTVPVADWLAVCDKLSRHMERRLGTSLEGFRAFLSDSAADGDGSQAAASPFARLAAAKLKCLGGDYAEWAGRVESEARARARPHKIPAPDPMDGSNQTRIPVGEEPAGTVPTPVSVDEWFAQIAPEVAEYRSGNFHLGPELRRLYAVREAAATEAIIFSCARILTALARDTVAAIGVEASENAFSNLMTLEQYSVLSTGENYSAQALRRLGNAARGTQESLTADHAELALALTEQVLQWFFFLDLPKKPAIRQLCRDEHRLKLATDETLRAALSAAEELGLTWPSGWAELSEQQGPALLRVPLVPAIIAETWLDRGKADAAQDILRDALDRHPNDLRLQQLALLALSRKGDLDAARIQIDLLMARSSDDEETIGIAAGVYKRLWKQAPAEPGWLRSSYKLYDTGWKISRQQNAYLGVNAATTALWLGKPDESRGLAADVAKLLSGRAERLRQSGVAHIGADFWSQVSLAESLLLQRELAQAAAAYRDAFEQYPGFQGGIQVAQAQLQEIAQALGIPQKDIEGLQDASASVLAFDETSQATAPGHTTPAHVGRYRVERILGQGSFGVAYLARDEQLQRPVAIKVAHRELVADPVDAEAYVASVRAAERLDHPHIVPVYDVGSSEEFPCFVVSKFIDGPSLAARLERPPRPSLREAIELTASVAEALHYAHKHFLVHSDIKPGNILLDSSGQPYVADFGLALRERDVSNGARFAGTPNYMSPEQVRGEGHRIDGRSDVFSLGVVLYELLTGQRPFSADTLKKLLAEVTGGEVRPPRQWDDTIPREAERIVLKALSKQVTDRYTTAKDFADDLRHFLAAAPHAEQSTVTGRRAETEEETPPVEPIERQQPQFDWELVARLPLPLAQLYHRAFNAREARSRHNNAFFLFEATVILAASVLVAGYARSLEAGDSGNPALESPLINLRRPSLGQWVGILHDLARHFGRRADAASHPLGHFAAQLEERRRELPEMLNLYRRIKNGPDGRPAGDQSCSLITLFASLVMYRNTVIGHGVDRSDAFYEREMGPLLFAAATDVLTEGVFDFLGPRGSRLVYLGDARALDGGRFEIEVRNLTGLKSTRDVALTATTTQSAEITTNRVAVLWQGHRLPLRLDPLLVFREADLNEDVCFLRADHGKQVEYLSYTSGRTERDRTTAAELGQLLQLVAGHHTMPTRQLSLTELQSRSDNLPAEFAELREELRALVGQVVLSDWAMGAGPHTASAGTDDERRVPAPLSSAGRPPRPRRTDRRTSQVPTDSARSTGRCALSTDPLQSGRASRIQNRR